MKFFLVFTVSVLFFASSVHAQKNLVPNPSFEEYEQCPSNYGKENYIEAKHWSNYHYTPDYFNECATNENVGVPSNFFGFQKASDGKAYVGLTVYHNSAPNELLGMELIEPIKKGKRYKFSIKVSLAEKYSNYATDNIGILFTNTPETAHDCGRYHFKSDKVIKDADSWTTIEGIFIADSDYKHMLIGNFFDRTKTTIEKIASDRYEASYYFLDEVSVVELSDISKPAEFSNKSTLKKGSTFILKNIFFDVNKDILKAESYKELDLLVALLTEHPKTNINIVGHTDAVGKDEDNLVLSKKRSVAVLNYLVSKGIAKERLQSIGMGESDPIATNNTEEGRAQNRRVAFTIQ